MGRAIFAVGGNANIASRLGYNLRTIHIFLFGYAGALAGLAASSTYAQIGRPILSTWSALRST